MRTLVWFRGKDLRVADHAPLREAARAGETIPLFVLDPYFFAKERAQRIPHRIQFLLESLRALADKLEHLGSKLVVVAGKSVDVIPRLARRWRVDRVVAHRWCEPFARERDRRIAAALDVPFDLYEGETLHTLGTVRSESGASFSVFTAFARAFDKKTDVHPPLAAPRRLPTIPRGLAWDEAPIPSERDLGIERNEDILEGGERAARKRLSKFLRGAAAEYHEGRDRLDRDGTSRLSQDLKFGTISARTVWVEAERALVDVAPRALASFHNELVWREFTHSTLWDRSTLLEEPFRPAWRGFPYRTDAAGWRAWVEGTTGYPIVDASARQLSGEGFVHNRARMISASFLTKHLVIDYRRGEQHYMSLLTDGDWAQNNAGWQWSSGSGCDAQPYFRVFNPVTQGERFDPSGDYVARWVPESAKLDRRWIHAPWKAPAAALAAAGITLGRKYPRPIVDHAFARARFLSVAHQHLKRPG